MSAFHVGEWLVEPTLNTLSKPDSTVRLEPKVMQVLVCLAEHPGKVISKDRLLQSVWPATFVTEDVLTRAVSELRHALGDDPRRARFIQTIPKGGYRLVASVTPPSDPEVAATVADGRSGSDRSGLAARHRRMALLFAALSVMLAAGAWRSWHWFRPPTAVITGSRPLTHSGQVMFPNRALAHFPSVATDGARVYFSRGSGVPTSWGEELAQVPADGGAIAPVRTPFHRQLLHHISPDGSRLLIRQYTTAFGLEAREGPLWALPVAGGGPLRLGDLPAHDAAWSSSGRQLAFARERELDVAAWDGSHPRKIATTPGRANWIRWAPDDRVLRFTLTDSNSRTSLWEVDVDGTRLRRLLPGWRPEAQPCCGEWSPDGRHFVFLAYEDRRSDIWIRRESRGFWRTGSDPVRLTAGPLHVCSAIFSRNGKSLLAVSSQERDTVIRFDLMKRRIEPFVVEGVEVLFSPDREWMVYIVPSQGTLWRSRIDGSEALQLTTPPLWAGWPAWSPDGKRIAFIGFPRGGPYKLYVVSSSGGAVRQLIPGDRQEIDPSWSPDGRSIMFGRPPDVMGEHGMPKAIHVIDLGSGETTTLPGSNGMFAPRWTPDGRFVLAIPHKNWDRLMRFDFVSRGWSELVPAHAANTMLSPDGEWVYFESDQGRNVSRARVRDGRMEHLLDFAEVTKGTLMACSLAGGVDLDGSPLLLCRVSASELYALDLDAP